MRSYLAFFLMALGIFFIDRSIKELFLNGLFFETKCVTLGYVLNRGIAFSMLAFLSEYLKWILLFLIGGVLGYLIYFKQIDKHPLIFGMLIGAALGNLYDRFVYSGVIDYFYWHCGFEFAVFNFADTIIDLSIIFLLYFHLKSGRIAQG